MISFSYQIDRNLIEHCLEDIDFSDSFKINDCSPSQPHNVLRKITEIDLGEVDDPLEDDSDFVMCRICEENVPSYHLESHTYICAYAEKCESEGQSVDERLINVTDMLEQIVDSYVQNFPPYSSPEIIRTLSSSSVIGSNCQSPKVLEWHNRGTEGMLEDLHEMDTACIDEPYLATYNNFKGHLAQKLGFSAVSSSTGSMTPVSSTSTPRTSHFDMFWLECNNNSDQEDKDQVIVKSSIILFYFIFTTYDCFSYVYLIMF